MTPLATVDQLEASLQFTPDEDQALQALTAASGLVRAITGQQFSLVPQETILLAGDRQILTLPQRPVVVDGSNPLTVVELGDFGAIDFACIEGRDFARIGPELRRGYPWWSSTRLQGWPYRYPLGVWAPRVQVTYSHGYATIPDEISGEVVNIAKALYTNPTGLRSFQTPEYSETYASELLGASTVDGIKSRLNAMGYRRGAFSVG